ncbi:MAG: 50S ribosomal protein L15 [Kiritimatiellaeota bacterium]|nr:50S ribosomal protein L15 [Kiritimatiellota bacterium]
MNLHTLKNTPGARKTRMRVGRGESSGKGKTSGKGNKGQMSRTGHKHKPTFEGGQMRLVRRIPKRGFHNPSRKAFLAVNIAALADFASGTEITPELLRQAGLARGDRTGGGIKILGEGELKNRLTVKAQAFSAQADDLPCSLPSPTA